MATLNRARIPIQDAVWMGVAPHLQAALTKSKNVEWTLTDVRAWLDRGDGILLMGMDDNGDHFASALCGLTTYMRLKSMEIYLMGADNGSDWQQFFPHLMEIGRAEGCDNIRVKGRRWIKFLQEFGEAREMYQCELTL